MALTGDKKTQYQQQYMRRQRWAAEVAKGPEKAVERVQKLILNQSREAIERQAVASSLMGREYFYDALKTTIEAAIVEVEAGGKNNASIISALNGSLRILGEAIKVLKTGPDLVVPIQVNLAQQQAEFDRFYGALSPEDKATYDAARETIEAIRVTYRGSG